MSLEIKLWGTRGSLPSPHTPQEIEARVRGVLEQFLDGKHGKKSEIRKFLAGLPPRQLGGYGGNTMCVQVNSAKSEFLIDCGSGIRRRGLELMGGPCGKGQGEVHIFFTHFHWDHILGLPFFIPLFVPGNKIHVYAVQPELEEMFQMVFRKPYFPVPYANLGAEIVYHRLEPRRPFKLGDATLTPYQLDHPDPCWGYKIQSGGRTYAHCVDTECRRTTPDALGTDLPLYQGADLMVIDAQYTLLEHFERVNWGHASATVAMEIAMREGIKRVLFVHHDPSSSDEKISKAELETVHFYESQMRMAKTAGFAIHTVDFQFAREGMVVKI